MTEEAISDERERSQRRVRKFYQISAQREWERLEQSQGAIEFAVTKAWIERFLPSPGASVLDLGGGPGRYSLWLADKGYRVTLADLSPYLLEMARGKASEAGATLDAVVQANACDLSQFGDDSFDAILCLGPLYHLFDESDRRKVASELARVVSPEGIVFAAFLNRVSVVRFAINQDLPFFTPYTFDLVKRWDSEGVFISPIPGIFTDAYFIHPRDIDPLMTSAGFETVDLISTESIADPVHKDLALFNERQPELYPWVMQRLIELANEPTAIGSGSHLMYIGRKP